MRRFFRRPPGRHANTDFQNNESRNQAQYCPHCRHFHSRPIQGQNMQGNNQNANQSTVNNQHVQETQNPSANQQYQGDQNENNQPATNKMINSFHSSGQNHQHAQGQQGGQNDHHHQCTCHQQIGQGQNQNENQNYNAGQNQQSDQNSSSQQSNQNTGGQNNQNSQYQMPLPIYKKVSHNFEFITRILGNPIDLVVRELEIDVSCGHMKERKVQLQLPKSQIELSIAQEKEHEPSSYEQVHQERAEDEVSVPCILFYLSGMANSDIINENILRMLQSKSIRTKENLIEQVHKEIISVTDTNKLATLEEAVNALLSGDAILMVDGEMTALEMATAGTEKRALDEPQSESMIRGPRISFIESLDINLTLIRGELRDPNLRFVVHEIGRRSKQKVVVCYVEGLTNPDIVNEVNRRLKTIDIDIAGDSGKIEQWIEDSFLSPFPQVVDTERPDRVIYNLMKGKIAILVDGCPFALMAPISVGDAFLAMEDHSQRWLIGSSIRMLRFVAMFIALFLPGLYVALTSYHPGMIPTQLTLSLAATREGEPFPAIIEVLLMAVTFEILLEAGIRLPKIIGQTIGIVGGIVIGDVAVSAGIVGPALVIVTSLTAMSSYTIPNYSFSLSLRILRFLFVIAASILGLYGIILVFIMICIHIVNLKSIGVPYSGAFAPNFLDHMKDLIIRAPVTALRKRPAYLEPLNQHKVNLGGRKQ
ncbi:spore germination protein [Ureibacillus sp. FSL K6-8385]|uniref:spore germination protein n=1 Tax=Ureibacillus sp. FSL K6-8385 TaxID=2954684 RepID=UPI0031595285